MKCPACDHEGATEHGTIGGVVSCERCGGVYTTRPIYLGESYELVLPRWDADGACPAGQERYFDLETLGSAGLERRHGWFNPETRRITQVG